MVRLELYVKFIGIQDIVAKSLGSSNPHNVVRACMKALLNQYSPKSISFLRGKKNFRNNFEKGINEFKFTKY